MTSSSQMSKTYTSTQISTSSNPANICMLHNRCTFFVKQALLPDQTEKRILLDKAQNIIAELEHALVIDDNLSRSLFYIYDYCYVLLENFDSENLQKALSLISVLRDTFTELFKNHH